MQIAKKSLNPSSKMVLNLSFQNLKNFEDFSKFKNLIELDVSGNGCKEQIRGLEGLRFLRKFTGSFNQISQAPELPNSIEHLSLNNNLISNITPILTLPLLISLNLSNNLIKQVSSLKSLQNL